MRRALTESGRRTRSRAGWSAKLPYRRDFRCTGLRLVAARVLRTARLSAAVSTAGSASNEWEEIRKLPVYRNERRSMSNSRRERPRASLGPVASNSERNEEVPAARSRYRLASVLSTPAAARTLQFSGHLMIARLSRDVVSILLD